MKKTLTLLIILALVNITTNAQEGIVTDRPDVTESSLTVPANSLQIEAGFQYSNSTSYTNNWYSSLSYTSQNSVNVIATLLRYGVNDKIELRFQPSFIRGKSSRSNNSDEIKVSGLGDMVLGLKAQLMEDDNASLAFLNMSTAPTGTSLFSADEFTSSNFLAYSHSLTQTFGIGYNLGVNYGFTSKNADLLYSISFAKSINDKIGMYAEFYGNYDADKHLDFKDEFFINYDMGLTYLVNSTLQLDLYYGFALNKRKDEERANDTNILGFGVSYRIDKKKD